MFVAPGDPSVPSLRLRSAGPEISESRVLWKLLGAMFIFYLPMVCASALAVQPEGHKGRDGLSAGKGLPAALWGKQLFIQGAFAFIQKTRCDFQRERVWGGKVGRRVRDGRKVDFGGWART